MDEGSGSFQCSGIAALKRYLRIDFPYDFMEGGGDEVRKGKGPLEFFEKGHMIVRTVLLLSMPSYPVCSSCGKPKKTRASFIYQS